MGRSLKVQYVKLYGSPGFKKARLIACFIFRALSDGLPSKMPAQDGSEEGPHCAMYILIYENCSKGRKITKLLFLYCECTLFFKNYLWAVC